MTDVLGNQREAGAVAWGIGEAPTVILTLLVAVAWVRTDRAESTRKDRQADRDGDAELAAYNAHLQELKTTQRASREASDDARAGGVTMRVAVLQIAYGDDEPMADRITRVADLVRAQAGHDLVVLPELWAPGGFSYREWDARAQPVDGSIGSAMSAAARDAGVLLHAGSIVERPASGEVGSDGHGLWNTSLVYGPDGSLVAAYRKIHRFGFGAGEPKLMDAGEEIVLVDLPAGRTAPRRSARAVDLLRPAVPRALPTPARRRRDGLHRAGRVACGAGAALDAARPRTGDREPVRRHRLQHGGHPRRHRDGWALPGDLGDRRGARHGRDQRGGAQC